MLPNGPGIIDIIYGGNVVSLFFWILFGIGGQSIIAIMVLGRKPFWADVCWGILRAQVPILFLIAGVTIFYPPGIGCFCGMNSSQILKAQLIHQANLSLYGIVYFSVMSIAVYFRFRLPPCLSPISVAGCLVHIVDIQLMTVILVLLFTR